MRKPHRRYPRGNVSLYERSSLASVCETRAWPVLYVLHVHCVRQVAFHRHLSSLGRQGDRLGKADDSTRLHVVSLETVPEINSRLFHVGYFGVVVVAVVVVVVARTPNSINVIRSVGVGVRRNPVCVCIQHL